MYWIFWLFVIIFYPCTSEPQNPKTELAAKRQTSRLGLSREVNISHGGICLDGPDKGEYNGDWGMGKGKKRAM